MFGLMMQKTEMENGFDDQYKRPELLATACKKKHGIKFRPFSDLVFDGTKTYAYVKAINQAVNVMEKAKLKVKREYEGDGLHSLLGPCFFWSLGAV